jgi:hypothetical protein
MVVEFPKYVIKPIDNLNKFLDEDYQLTDRIDEALLFDSEEVATYYLKDLYNSSLFEVNGIKVGYKYNA